MSAEDVVRLLGLEPHPVEGGYFRETHRAALNLERGATTRSVGTAIYYLLTGDMVSEMHVLVGDEVFHHYLGDPLEMLQLHPGGATEVVVIGPDLAAGQRPQVAVPGGVWQGSRRVGGPVGFTLIGATMAPGFDYADYATGQRAELSAQWPAEAGRIAALTPRG